MITLRHVTYDDFLTLTLAERVAWLHTEHGPHGFLSHDDFAERLGTSRQVVIGWEKEGGSEPKKFVEQLATFSGFPAEAFLRRTAEVAVKEMYGRRLGKIEARHLRLQDLVLEGFALLELQVEIEDDEEPARVRRAPRRQRRGGS